MYTQIRLLLYTKHLLRTSTVSHPAKRISDIANCIDPNKTTPFKVPQNSMARDVLLFVVVLHHGNSYGQVRMVS